MTNFDFLKSFNRELYEIGVRLEEDVINSPRAVTADATQFLEILVKDIYRLSRNKMNKNLVSFYKKTDNLYRLGVISYIFKNKLQDAYNLRNKIHKNYENLQDEISIAFDLHKRLYFISKKYFRDFSEIENITIPDYKKPERTILNFDRCIICGSENKYSKSNMCPECNKKIDDANLLLSIKNTLNSDFTKRDLIYNGLSESEANFLINDLLKENIIFKKGSLYRINNSRFDDYLKEIDEYIDIGMMITKFYNDEISAFEIKNTLEYWKGGIKQKPYAEFYRLVNKKLGKNFEETLIKSRDIKKSMKRTSMDDINIREWFDMKKEEFISGDLDDSFILFNELLIEEYFRLKRKNIDDDEIKNKLSITDKIYDFWKDHFMSNQFMKKTLDIKKYLIINEIKKNKKLKDVLLSVGVTQKEFEEIYNSSKNSNDEFYKSFDKQYTNKRQKNLLKHLRINNLNKAIKLSKITKTEFYKWYYDGEKNLSDFYIKTTKILMNQFLQYRLKGLSKKEIFKKMNISKDMVKSWSENKQLDFVIDFEDRNKQITSNLIKRGKIINALKEDKSKTEAILSAGITHEKFMEIYNLSKKQKNNFHIRFDEEYAENRKRLFTKLLKSNDFYNTIQKCEISQKEFNEWYIKDQDIFIATKKASDFYLKTTQLLMGKYIESRKKGKNKPDSARSVGLSNSIIDKWFKHSDLELYAQFKSRNYILERDFTVEGFKNVKSINEISEEYDISVKSIDEFINLGQSGFLEFKEVSDLYQNFLIPRLFKRFLSEFKSKSFTKSLKLSKLTENELNYFYQLGKLGNENFKDLSDEYLKIKIDLYVNNILLKKSSKIAFKNSNLTEDEFRENEAEINDKILDGRFNIIADEIEKHKSTGTKLAKKVGIDVEELYMWYRKGKEGDEKFKEFSYLFEISMIIPRVMAYRHSVAMGVPKNWIHKKLKKELGVEEYKIWDKYAFISQDGINQINLDPNHKEKLINILNNSEFVKSCIRDDSDVTEFMKTAVKSNSNFKKPQNHISKNNLVEIDKNEIICK